MNKLNKKGFTLIELLVVLVLLVVIMAIAIPSITSTVERNKEKDKANKIELAKSAAELYIDEYRTCPSVKATTLIDGKYLPGVEAKEVCDGASNCCFDKDGNKVDCAGSC